MRSTSSAPHRVRAVFVGAVPEPPQPAREHGQRTRRPAPRTHSSQGINIVPQQEAWVVERFGKFHTVLEPGLNVLIPFVDSIRYAYSLKVAKQLHANPFTPRRRW